MKLDWKNELAYIRLVGPDEKEFRESVQKIWDYIDHFEKHRRDWPSDLHEQYLAILDERDEIQSMYDELRWRMDGLEK